MAPGVQQDHLRVEARDDIWQMFTSAVGSMMNDDNNDSQTTTSAQETNRKTPTTTTKDSSPTTTTEPKATSTSTSSTAAKTSSKASETSQTDTSQTQSDSSIVLAQATTTSSPTTSYTAIDVTSTSDAGSVLTLATTQPSSTTSTASSTSASASATSTSTASSSGTSTAAKAGIAFGVLGGVLAIFLLIFFFFRKHQKQSDHERLKDEKDALPFDNQSIPAATATATATASAGGSNGATTDDKLNLGPSTVLFPAVASAGAGAAAGAAVGAMGGAAAQRQRQQQQQPYYPDRRVNRGYAIAMQNQLPMANRSGGVEAWNQPQQMNSAAKPNKFDPDYTNNLSSSKSGGGFDFGTPGGGASAVAMATANVHSSSSSVAEYNALPSPSSNISNPFGDAIELPAAISTDVPRTLTPAVQGNAAEMAGSEVVAGAAVGAAAAAGGVALLTRKTSLRKNDTGGRDLTTLMPMGPTMDVVPGSPVGTEYSFSSVTTDQTPGPAGGAAGGQATSMVHRVQMDFKPTLEDELELRVGQLVRLLHEYDDGWALCIRLDRSQQGVVPRTCLSTRPVKPRPHNRPGPPGNPNGARPMSPMNPQRPTLPAGPAGPLAGPMGPMSPVSPMGPPGASMGRPQSPYGSPMQGRQSPAIRTNNQAPYLVENRPQSPSIQQQQQQQQPQQSPKSPPGSSPLGHQGSIGRKPVPGQAY